MPPEDEGPSEPPANPEDWSDELWLAWLRRTDAILAAENDEPSPRVTAKWRDRAGATVLGAAMLGLRDAIYGRKDEIVIVQEAAGDPPDDDRPQVFLDPEHPERSRVVVRGSGRRRTRRRG